MALELPRIHPSDTLTRGRAVVEPDTPIGPAHEGDSVQVLTDALRGIDRDTLVAALTQLAAPPASGKKRRGKVAAGGDDDGTAVTAALIRRLGVAAIAAFSLIAPVSAQLAETLLSPSSQIETKLDTVLREQAVTQATILSLAKWVVDCERARSTGAPLPEMPAAVRLILAEDDMARSTGP